MRVRVEKEEQEEKGEGIKLGGQECIGDEIKLGVQRGIGEEIKLGVQEGIGAEINLGVQEGIGNEINLGVQEGIGNEINLGVQEGIGDEINLGLQEGTGEGIKLGVQECIGEEIKLGLQQSIGEEIKLGVQEGEGIKLGVQEGIGDEIKLGIQEGIGEEIKLGVQEGIGHEIKSGVQGGIGKGIKLEVQEGRTPKNLNQVTCPNRDSNPVYLVSRPDALTVTPQVWTPDVRNDTDEGMGGTFSNLNSHQLCGDGELVFQSQHEEVLRISDTGQLPTAYNVHSDQAVMTTETQNDAKSQQTNYKAEYGLGGGVLLQFVNTLSKDNEKNILPHYILADNYFTSLKTVDAFTEMGVKTYNSNMGGTDIMDQNVSSYRTSVHSKKWCWSTYIWILNVSLKNAWHLHRRSTIATGSDTYTTPILIQKERIYCITERFGQPRSNTGIVKTPMASYVSLGSRFDNALNYWSAALPIRRRNQSTSVRTKWRSKRNLHEVQIRGRRRKREEEMKKGNWKTTKQLGDSSIISVGSELLVCSPPNKEKKPKYKRKDKMEEQKKFT
ncbi:hypothetical protein ANN_23311 [Periplaneta americana]|uniref:PiggyBac transposable element-derived protein domain-containing protein n=1 Tax=Periplaneta americana TaxID=6978 RepID=A0ABQ8SKT8_PERAM|nr:hypothetical protein ANN_23311 [Periplaneta americana]